MNVTQKIIDDITQEIIKRNNELGQQGIPHSDQLIKFMQASMGIPSETAKMVLRLLIESHRILSIEIVAEDQKHDIDRVEGYIYADLRIIGQLKSFFQDILCQMYEKQFHKHLLIHQVIKELFPIIKNFNNTELGQIANKTIMLMEYERMIEKDYSQFSIDYQERKLVEISIREHFIYSPKIDIPIPESAKSESAKQTSSADVHPNFGRAIDSPLYREFSEKKDHYPIQRILNIYGIDFFLKVNFRKYQFSNVRKLVEDKQITKREDLLLLKSMLDLLKERVYSDKELEHYKNDIYALERTVSHALYFTTSRSR
ncbi:MAG: hypothetical protein ACRCUT_07905 [Spirochaetota bacterium]